MSKKVRIGITCVCVLALLYLVKVLLDQKISTVQDFQNYMKGFGIAAPLVLLFFQALQVAVPILPGYLGCIGGAIAFGPAVGFWCNYIGISVGSIAAYYLGRKYGVSLVLSMFSKTQYEKWKKRIENSRSYAVFLFVATLLPAFPDDLFCYFSGLMNMNSKKFIWIIILGKPWCILAYSLLADGLASGMMP